MHTCMCGLVNSYLLTYLYNNSLCFVHNVILSTLIIGIVSKYHYISLFHNKFIHSAICNVGANIKSTNKRLGSKRSMFYFMLRLFVMYNMNTKIKYKK